MSELRFGLIGLGHWGPNYARLLRGQVPNASLAACADLRDERLRPMGRLYPGVRLHADHREMLEAGELDAVIVATTAATHRRVVEDCLRAGMHVLVDKLRSTKTNSEFYASMSTGKN